MNILTLLQGRDFLWGGFFLLLFYLGWLVNFKLAFKIVDQKMPPSAYLGVLIMVSYVSFARPFIPHLTFVALMGILLMVLLCIFGRLGIYRSIYGAIFPIFISFVGDIFLLHLTLGIYPKLFPFVFGSKEGFLIAFGVEVLFPVIALFAVGSKFSLRLPLRKNQPFGLFDLGVSWTLGCMYYAMDYALNIAFESFQTNPQKIGSSLGFLFVTSFGIMGGILIIIRCMKIMYDREINKLQEEKEQIEEEKEQVEAKNIDLQEKVYSIIDFDSNFSPEKKKFIVDSLVAIFEEGAKKNSRPKPPFIINQSKMAEYGIEERDSKILAHLVLNKTNQEIASELDYTEGHIANSLTEMYKKLKVKGRRQLIRFTLDNKLVEIP